MRGPPTTPRQPDAGWLSLHHHAHVGLNLVGSEGPARPAGGGAAQLPRLLLQSQVGAAARRRRSPTAQRGSGGNWRRRPLPCMAAHVVLPAEAGQEPTCAVQQLSLGRSSDRLPARNGGTQASGSRHGS